jgi:hypothetical protein
MPPRPAADPALFTHAIIILTVVISITVLLAIGKIGENSATPLFGAAIGVGGLAARPQKTNGT